MWIPAALLLSATAAHAAPNAPCPRQTAAQAVPLDKQLMSLSIEFDSAVKFFGDVGKPNRFSKQLLQNIVDRSKVPTILRIGGNTQDRASFCPTCPDTMTTIANTDPNDPKKSEAARVTFNAKLFDVLTNNVPRGSPIIFGLNYRNNSLALAQQEIQAAYDHLDQSVVMAYELGNEVNLYGSYRPADYDVNDYARDMRQWIPSLRGLKPSANAKFQSPSFAGPELVHNGLSLANLVQLGLPQSLPEIEYFSLHGYPYDICSPASAKQVDLRNFLNHTKTRSLIGRYGTDLAAIKLFGKKVHMGETGSVACHGKSGVSDTLGAALWELDYALTGTVSGINRFFFHMGQGDYYYSMWEPLDKPHIYPTYYAMLFVADLVADLKNPRVAPMPDVDTDTAVHYAVYDGNELKKLVLLNLDYYDGQSTAARPTKSFGTPRLLGKKLKVRRLTGANSVATTGVTWAEQHVNEQGSVVGALKTETVEDGWVKLAASEAVIVERA